ncbi:hypothetical protein [Piscirickettsia litoralis]|uniref:Uncharacterized protein n=1 Tax=Piscirickettsia litoralis TaxID=1891921 RepID=A0ABX3A3W6_9GAMM|nr:hypothetical protein [Piscirickettsia litoralis]ODN43215.1 hypothetical protein BGC07_10155 [Piscirickettsia litoralis]
MNHQYTLISMTFNLPETQCTLKNMVTTEELYISINQLAQQGHLLKQLNKESLTAVLFQLEQENQILHH